MDTVKKILSRMLEDIEDSEVLTCILFILLIMFTIGLVVLAIYYPKILILYALLALGGWVLSAYYRAT